MCSIEVFFRELNLLRECYGNHLLVDVLRSEERNNCIGAPITLMFVSAPSISKRKVSDPISSHITASPLCLFLPGSILTIQ